MPLTLNGARYAYLGNRLDKAVPTSTCRLSTLSLHISSLGSTLVFIYMYGGAYISSGMVFRLYCLARTLQVHLFNLWLWCI